jgi:uncharacterized protein (DUF2062 family)
MVKLDPRNVTASLLPLLRQGITPARLAFTVALGFGIGCFPVIGTTTVMCLLVALAFRLNLPAIQVGNYLAFPLQFLLVIPFLRLGERIFHAGKLSLSPQELVAMTHNPPEQTMRVLIAAQWHAMFAWLVVMPWVVALLTLILRPFIARLLALARRPVLTLPS